MTLSGPVGHLLQQKVTVYHTDVALSALLHHL